jgi:hypothetical protein
MLTPAQVIPFLASDRSFVREHALRYFEESGEQLPLTADHLWDAIDRFDPLETLGLVDHLQHVPQSEHAYQRLLGTLVARPTNLFEYHVQRAVADIDFDLLAVHCDELLSDPRLPEETRQHLEQRLALAAAPVETLWDRLMRHGDEMAHKYAGQFDSRLAERLIEAISRAAGAVGGGELVQRIRAALRDPQIAETWNEVFLVKILSRLPREVIDNHAGDDDFIDLLIEKLLIDDAGILNQNAYEALARIGSIRVVEKIEAAYPGKNWGVRIFAREPLHRIKRPESEAALLRLLEREEDRELQAILVHDLCDLGSMAGLEQARALIVSNPTDPELRELCATTLATAIMTGTELPAAELAVWKQRTEREEARRRELRWEMNDGFLEESSGRDSGMIGRRLAALDADLGDDGLPPIDPFDAIGDGPALVGVEPYRRDAPKIGRNDPCPCGSGKKFKKCCGG